MRRLLKYKKLTWYFGLLLVPFLITGVFVVPATQAVSLNYFGTTCPLLTGGTGTLQSDNETCCPNLTTTNDDSCLLAKYVNPAIDLLSAVVGLIVVIAVIVGAIEYITSAGDPQRAASGQKHITNALLGLFAYALLYGFLQFLIPGGLFHG